MSKRAIIAVPAVLLLVLAFARAVSGKRSADRSGAGPSAQTVPAMVLEGGRRIEFLRTVSSERETNPKRSFWKRVVDVVIGPPEYHHLVRPYSIATDSHGRLLITDPGARLVHVFDFEKKKYLHLDGGKHEPFQSPIGIAVDGEDNIYVTDSRLGKIFVFDPQGKFRRIFGNAGGEGFFKRPTGIAFDPERRLIYVTDTLRDKIFILDLDGNILGNFGKPGTGPGEFNYPTEVVARADELFVVDAMNFRIQIFDRHGGFRGSFGRLGNITGTMNRPKGLGIDSEGDLYLVDALFETVQVFDRKGQLLYYFGHTGSAPAEFELPSGLWIDAQDKVYIADSYNHRIQIYQFVSAKNSARGPQQ